ncbi:SDR family NAD(P)-dependent oxidoreductase, partial [Vibrio parahaemolyticus]
MNTYDKKWALVTGALGGIGHALVEEYSRAGYHVIATDVKEASDSFMGLGNVNFLQLNLEKIAQSEEFSLGFYKQVQM